MHDKAKEQLIQLLRKSISESTIESDAFGNPTCFVENEKIDAAIAKHTGDNMGHRSYWIFVLNFYLSRHIKKQTQGPAKDILNPVDINIISTKVIDYIASIPRRYKVYIPLNGGPSTLTGYISVGNDANIVSKRTLSGTITPLLQSNASLFLEVAEYGFSYAPLIGHQHYIANSLEIESINVLKRFLYFGSRFGILDTEFINDEKLPGPVWATIVDEIDGHIVPGYFLVEQRLADYLTEKQILDKQAELRKAATKLQEKVGAVFDANLARTTRWSTLATSSQWYIDSDVNINDFGMSFIFRCIALESILSEGIDAGAVTRSLSDRAAYLLGRDSDERDEIRRIFGEVYRLRSKIVHGAWSGRHTSAEYDLFFQLKFLVDGLIHKEQSARNLPDSDSYNTTKIFADFFK